jgi:hypothetical protein
MSNEELAIYLKRLAIAIPKGAPKDLEGLAFAWAGRFADVTPEMMEVLLEQAMETFDSYPSLKQIKDMLLGSPEDNAREVGQLIWAALYKYKSQMSYWDKIAAYIGPLGVEVVEAMGGWRLLCDTLTDDDRPSFIAQTRDLAQSLQKKPIIKRNLELPSKDSVVTREIEKLADQLSLAPARPLKADQHED